MKKPIKTWLKGISLLAVASVSLAAANVASAEEVTIWCWDPNFNVKIMQEAADRYSKTHPDITFNIVDFAKADVEQKLQVALASGATNVLPDIVLIEDYYSQRYLQAFPGSFAEIGAVVDHSVFAPYKVELMSVDGKVYGMPFDSGVTGLFYRIDYLAEAGFSPADMQNITWDRYLEIGQAVVDKTGHKMMGLDPNDAGLTRIMMQSGGQWYFDKSGEELNIIGNEALAKSLEVQQKLQQSNMYKPAAGWAEYVGSFTSGETASVVSGVWMIGTVKSQPDQSGKWGVAPVPRLDIEGSKNASNLGGSSWYVLETADEKDIAIDFLDEIYAKDLGFYQTILQDRGAVGSLMASRDGDAYQTPDPFFNNEPVWQNFSEWLGEIPAVNYGVYTPEADSAVVALLPAIKDGMPIEEALKAIDAQVRSQTQ
ncbi:MAG: ABC transporter substrate-binding protein [Hyphomicrobiales bacterium]|nr:MAG: ABC transporter substrate-binding protein [Hyphomicrobiales bacterium]